MIVRVMRGESHNYDAFHVADAAEISQQTRSGKLTIQMGATDGTIVAVELTMVELMNLFNQANAGHPTAIPD